MTDQTILLERGPVTTLTLNRPELGNMVNDDSLERLAAAVRELAADDGCRVVVVRGAGEHFCRGRDGRPAPGAPKPTAFTRRASLERIIAVNTAFRSLGAVTVAVVQGEALGFGCGLAVQCDFTLAAEGSTFGFPEIEHALPPTIVLSYIGRYVARKRVGELILTARRLSAQQAEAYGLVNRVVPAADLETELSALTESLLAKDPLALRTAKQFLSDADDLSVDQASRYGINLLSVVLSAKD
jgi:enoyl-CoA hydratase